MSELEALQVAAERAWKLLVVYHELPESRAQDAVDAVNIAKAFILAAGAAMEDQDV